ncbi:MAG: hypothetical protein ABI920_04590 [Casimicrobiaceae bacterium]
MERSVVAEFGRRKVVLLDSISSVDPADGGHVVVSGSHGGRSAAVFTMCVPTALCCFNDAGVGKDGAGIAALALLDGCDLAAVACSHASARIGEARDTWESGVIAHVNAAASRRGLCVGEGVQAAVRRVFGT